MLRLFKGLLGAWAGVTITTLLISVMNGSILSATVTSLSSMAMLNLIFAAIGAVLIAFVEKPTWYLSTYAIAGIFTTGLVIFLGFCALAQDLAQLGVSMDLADYVLTAVTCAAQGFMTGIGYRYINGVAGANQ